jgi:hypothetical protein
MAYLGKTYRVEDMPEEQDYQPLPPGWYVASVEGADLKITKDGTGRYMSLKLKVTGPTHAGRVVFGNITLENRNETAKKIGLSQLGVLLRACGLASCDDTDVFVGSTIKVKLSVSSSEQYGARNELKDIAPLRADTGFGTIGQAPWAPQAAPAPRAVLAAEAEFNDELPF